MTVKAYFDPSADTALADQGGREALATIASSGTSTTIDLINANVFDVTLTASDCSLTFTGATTNVSCSFTLILRQDGTGGRGVTWPTSVLWESDGATPSVPVLSSAANAIDVLTFTTVDGGTNWFGVVEGLGFQ